LSAAVGAPREEAVEVLSRHQKVFVDADRSSSLVRSRTLLRARTAADRVLLRYIGDPGADPGDVTLGAENTVLGTVLRHRDRPVVVAELLFGTTLRGGETWILETRLRDPGGERGTCFAHGFAAPTEHCVLEVRFDTAARPARAHAFAQGGPAETRTPVRSLPVGSRLSAHTTTRGAGRGLVGIAWEWPV